MARLPRLALPGHAHWVIQRLLPGVSAFGDETDRRHYLNALREAAAAERVQVHGWAFGADEVHLLLTPPAAAALSRTMQAIGRRYVSDHNRRHGRRGTLWDGRFRAAVVEAGAPLLEVLLLVDGAVALADPVPLASSAQHRRGTRREAWLVDPPEVWALGNTPFDREAAWTARLAQGLPADRLAALRRAALGSWAIGSPGFRAQVAAHSGRPGAPRPRGRPRRAASTDA